MVETYGMLPGEDRLDWRISSSCEGGACIGMAALAGRILLGDIALDAGNVLDFKPEVVRAFTDGIKNGAYDNLT